MAEEGYFGLRDMTKKEALEVRVRENPNKTFVYFEDEEISYEEFNIRVNRVANGLLNRGVGQGDKICLLLPNRPEFLYFYFANEKIGAISVPVNTRYESPEIQYQVNHSDACILVTNCALLEKIRDIKKTCPNLKNIIVTDAEAAPDNFTMAELVRGMSPKSPQHEVRQGDIDCIIYTSGTSSGEPKGVLWPTNLIPAAAFCKATKLTSEGRVITVSAFIHSNGLLAVWMAIVSGASLVFPEKFSASGFWDMVARYKPTHFVSVATFVAILMTLPKSEAEKQTPLKVIFAAGIGKMYDEVKERYGVEVVDCYGMTEAGLITTTVLGSEHRRGSCGRIPPWVDMKIVDGDDREVPTNTPGEVVVKNPLLFGGYYKNDQANKEAMRDGWFHTGDLCRIDEEGFVWFVDRKKHIVRRGGENVSAAEVEAVLNNHPAIKESAVIGVPDKVMGEEIKAYLILKEGQQEPSYEEIAAYCRERLANFKVPRYFEYRAEFPKTISERTIKAYLKEEAQKEFGEGRVM